ncbi:unnamed protein product [Phytomonas sp. Hart1]|nr:unnamed protein product [Phytomonas sp. Hart1]|eukprot:CCW68761.1 unnamed protein product [Phytomonas sp. isolate Hart1]
MRKKNKDRSSVQERNDSATAEVSQSKQCSFFKEPPQAHNDLLPFSDVMNRYGGRPYGAYNSIYDRKYEEWLEKIPPPSILSEIKSFLVNDGYALFSNETKNSLLSAIVGSENDASNEVARSLISRLSNKSLQQWWWRDIAERYPSTPLYPFYEITFEYPDDSILDDASAISKEADADSPPVAAPSEECVRVAAMIRRIISAYVHCSSVASLVDCELLPDVERLLSHAVYSKGYGGPQSAKNDTAFVRSASPEDVGREFMKPNEPRSLFVVHQTDFADHINVCCGDYYYRLRVVDRQDDEALVPAHVLENGLEAIRRHARARKASMVEFEARADEKERRVALGRLLGRLSTLHDDVSADLRRRLREVSPVNAYTLDQLESGLFTIVLRDGEAAEEGSEWLHSILSFYIGWGRPRQVRVRSHASMVSFGSFGRFLAAALDTPGQVKGKPTSAPSCEVGPSLSPPGGQPKASHVLQRGEPKRQWKEESSLCVSLDSAEVACYLELWLPLPAPDGPPLILPHTPAPSFSPWMPLGLRGGPVNARLWTVAELSLCILLAVQSVIPPDDGNSAQSTHPTVGEWPGRPMVYLVMLHDRHAAPTVRRLYSSVVERFIQVYRSQSYLLFGDVRTAARRAALRSVNEELQSCFTASHPLFPMASSLANSGVDVEMADVCITLCVVPRRNTFSHAGRCAGTSETRLKWGTSYAELAIPARVRVHLCVQADKEMKKVILGDCVCKDAEVSHALKEEQFANCFYTCLSQES